MMKMNEEEYYTTDLPTCPACGHESDWTSVFDNLNPDADDYGRHRCEACGESYVIMVRIVYRYTS